VQLSTLPHLSQALAVLATDIGAVLNQGAVFPEKWAARAQDAERELSRLDPGQVEKLVVGEEMDQEEIQPLAPATHGLLCDAFDGDLSDLLYVPLTSALDYQGVENLSDELTKQKIVLQQGRERT
jgi:hypothetical protein